ncbi:MAG: helix-turn-helix domain-containing protein [Oscillospiraceae bacterium]
MSLEDLRERNKALVIEKALYCFTEQGIARSKVSDIARAAGLAERSLYRYFKTKAELVHAAAYLFWHLTTADMARRVRESHIDELPGIDQIRALLYFYSNMYFENPKGVLFTIEAEMFLYSAYKNSQILSRPPEKYETSNSPLVLAIRRGIADGSVSSQVNAKELYYNSYDSILSIMQKLALEASGWDELDKATRLHHLCDVFTSAFQGLGL